MRGDNRPIDRVEIVKMNENGFIMRMDKITMCILTLRFIGGNSTKVMKKGK